MKPLAPAEIRGEFKPIATSTPGVDVCEHLPQLAACNRLWSMCRSLTHKEQAPGSACHSVLTGWTVLPTGGPATAERRPRRVTARPLLQ